MRFEMINAESAWNIDTYGNDGNDTLFYPAAYDNVLGIGSVNQSKTKSTFSQYNGSVFAVASGQDVSPINIRDGKAFVYIKNNSADAIDAVSIFAEYDGAKYKGMTTKKLTLSNNQETLAEANYSGNTLTHLLWDSLNGLKPLANMRKKAAAE